MNHHGWLYCIAVGLSGSFAIIAALVGIVTGIVRFYRLLKRRYDEDTASFGTMGILAFFAIAVVFTLACKGILK